MSASDLRRAVKYTHREYFEDAVQLLVDNSQIEPFEIGNGEHYRAKK
jgi:hypothetical protein